MFKHQIKKDNLFQSTEIQSKINLPSQGRKSIFYPYENELISYFNELREKKIAVSSYILIEKIYTLNNDLKKLSYDSVHHLLYRILKKNNITLRKATHIGQTLPPHSFDIVYKFIYRIIKERKRLEIFDDEVNLNRIVNVEKTPEFLELISSNTYNKKGEKEVIINMHGNEKHHIIVILTITGKGNKLPLFINFKDKIDKTNEKRYNKLDVVKQKRVIFCQENGWVNDYIFKNGSQKFI